MTNGGGGGGDYALALSEAELERYRVMAEAARSSEGQLWARAGIVPGAAVADIGCGPGALLTALAETVGADGSVTAVDAQPQAVAAATALVGAAGLGNVTVRTGRAEATGLPAGSFDVVMMRHVLAHNGGREQAIVDHLAGLLRPGGVLYLVDIDASGMRIRPTDPVLEEMSARYWEFHASKGNDVQVGLRLAELLGAAGLEVLDFSGRYVITVPPPGVRPPAWAAREAMTAAGFATPEDVARWDAALTRLSTVRRTVFTTLFTGLGRRP
jgi:SAM-dependent methyltransferase